MPPLYVCANKHRQNAGKTHIFLEMRAAVCYSRDTDIYSQNTSLTNSFYGSVTPKHTRRTRTPPFLTKKHNSHRKRTDHHKHKTDQVGSRARLQKSLAEDNLRRSDYRNARTAHRAESALTQFLRTVSYAR